MAESPYERARRIHEETSETSRNQDYFGQMHDLLDRLGDTPISNASDRAADVIDVNYSQARNHVTSAAVAHNEGNYALARKHLSHAYFKIAKVAKVIRNSEPVPGNPEAEASSIVTKYMYDPNNQPTQ